MTTVLLVRHGLTATTGQLLTGWTPGVGLDDRGRAQARALGARIAAVPLDAIVTSPLDRCQQTVAELIAARGAGHAANGQAAQTPLAGQADQAQQEAQAGRLGGDPVIDDRVGECKYGDWTGKPLAELAKDPLWPVVQAHPSAVTFPGSGGESMLDMQHRAVSAVRDWNVRLGKDATYLICSHGDVIKAIVADSLGLHLDQCQRIVADPCSLTVISYTTLRPFLLRLNDTGGGVADLLPKPKPAGTEAGTEAPAEAGSEAGAGVTHNESDAMIGGGAGSAHSAYDAHEAVAAQGAEG